jgi:hypothetical protein
MRPSPFRLLVIAWLSGLFMAACGDAPEVERAPAAEPLGVQESAMCSGLSVTQLSINGISTYLGEMAGNGPWSVSAGANAVRLEYYVDGELRSIEERMGTSDTWYFSTSGLVCGTHNFMGNRTVCLSNSVSVSHSVTEACPGPSASMSCSRVSSTTLRCTGSATGGSGSYNPQWQEWEYGSPMGWYAGTMVGNFYCLSPGTSGNFTKKIEFKVIDGNGAASNLVTRSYSCRVDLR